MEQLRNFTILLLFFFFLLLLSPFFLFFKNKNSPGVEGKEIKHSQVQFINAQVYWSGNQYAICGALVLKV